jgi:hypothetical protein
MKTFSLLFIVTDDHEMNEAIEIVIDSRFDLDAGAEIIAREGKSKAMELIMSDKKFMDHNRIMSVSLVKIEWLR